MKSFAEHQSINLIEGAFNIGIASSDTDNKDVNKLVKYLQNKSGSELVMVSNSKGQVKVRREFTDDIKDILAWIEDNGLKIPWGTTKLGDGSVGEGGVKISESTQEIMVAALVLNKYKGGTLSTEEAVKVIDNAKKKFNKVQGASGRPELLDQFDSNFNDLATAISSSNAILKEVPNPVKAYWTGQGWHKDIAKYNPKIGNIKDYNSSDIVVKSSNGKFYGFSLKKKGATKEADPTLINKPITGEKSLLKDIMSSSDVAQLEKSKDLFFNFGLEKYYKGQHTRKQISQMSDKDRNKLINGVPTKEWSNLLRNPRNVFFRRAESLIAKNTQEFVAGFLNLVFRTDLEGYFEGGEFTFYLLTGIGKKKGDQVVVEDAKTSELIKTIDALKDVYDSKLTVDRTSGKLQAWEPKAGAAKVFLTISSDGVPLLDIEIRYKGSYTANPQFQAMATANFKQLFKKKK